MYYINTSLERKKLFSTFNLNIKNPVKHKTFHKKLRSIALCLGDHHCFRFVQLNFI